MSITGLSDMGEYIDCGSTFVDLVAFDVDEDNMAGGRSTLLLAAMPERGVQVAGTTLTPFQST